ncbi:MAG: helix-turn-helix domain-containing protein [Achromobacter sp.]|uniref:helix-turn-helix domain-containing protein n=1 Tax=Achromobacter sp. TaxID=134375 RepID=UPI003D00328D
MSLAQRLHTLMRWRGIKSQNQLARISGVSQSCIHRILTRKDRYSPSRATVLRLARALDTSVPWLTDGVAPNPGSPSKGSCQQDEAGDGYCAEIHALLRQHPESTRKTVLQVVRLMLKEAS